MDFHLQHARIYPGPLHVHVYILGFYMYMYMYILGLYICTSWAFIQCMYIYMYILGLYIHVHVHVHPGPLHVHVHLGPVHVSPLFGNVNCILNQVLHTPSALLVHHRVWSLQAGRPDQGLRGRPPVLLWGAAGEGYILVAVSDPWLASFPNRAGGRSLPSVWPGNEVITLGMGSRLIQIFPVSVNLHVSCSPLCGCWYCCYIR